jgi:hypothetical protein
VPNSKCWSGNTNPWREKSEFLLYYHIVIYYEDERFLERWKLIAKEGERGKRDEEIL